MKHLQNKAIKHIWDLLDGIGSYPAWVAVKAAAQKEGLDEKAAERIANAAQGAMKEGMDRVQQARDWANAIRCDGAE